MNLFKKIYKRIFPDPVYYQVYVVKSDPFGEIITPFQFRIDQIRNEEELHRLAKAAREKVYGKATGFWTSVSIERAFTTVKCCDGITPDVSKTYEMGRYSCTRDAEPTIHVNIFD